MARHTLYCAGVGQSGRRVAAGLLSWVLTLGVVGITVHPEPCGRVTRSEVAAAAGAAVDWFSSTISPNGRFTYRYDLGQGRDLGGYSGPRHSGAVLALYQAASHQIPKAEEAADLALGWALDKVVDTPIGPAFGIGALFETGSTALLVAALDERRLLHGSTEYDDLMVRFGHTLEATVSREGAVDAVIDPATGPLPQRSRFYTGEVLWALSRLHLTFPSEGFDQAALRVRRYLIEDRDSTEDPWPPISDHWGAYAFETMSRWPQPPTLDSEAIGWIDRQLWMLGLQTRYESQRVGGITRLTRGDVALPAGVGTLGEAYGAWLRLDSRINFLGERREIVEQRAMCVTSLLVERQTRASAGEPADPMSAGAWFRQGVSQVDDQQHPLATLLSTLDWIQP